METTNNLCVGVKRYIGEENIFSNNCSTINSIQRLIESSKQRKKLRVNSSSNDLVEHEVNIDVIDVHVNSNPDLQTHNNEIIEELNNIIDNKIDNKDINCELSNIDDSKDDDNTNDNTDDIDVNLNIDNDSYVIIGSEKRSKNIKLKPILPNWIKNAIVFNGDIKQSVDLDAFSHIINEPLINELKRNSINSLFPVQQKVIPHLIKCFKNSGVLRAKDVCVSSPTGSGKTLSFVIPIIQHLHSRVVTAIRVLIVLPVRDLAIQVFHVFEKYCKSTSLKVGLAIGHKSFKEEYNALIRQGINQSKYHSLVDILVATPGKLVDLIQRAPGFSLKHLEILVIDEADRMMSDITFNWLQEIENCIFTAKSQCFCDIHCDLEHRYKLDYNCVCYNSNSIYSKSVHKILFSATLSNDPEKLKSLSLFEPILFMASKQSSENNMISTKTVIPVELEEFMVISEAERKPLIIYYLLEVLNYRKVLCFTGSVENTHRLFELIKQMSNIVVAEFSSKLNARKREKLLSKFVDGKIDVIVCSDIFARGLDIDGIKCVICYDPPRNETAYIHRIGRTARAGNNGTAITLLSPSQLQHFNIIVRRVHKNNRNLDKLAIKKLIVKDNHLKPLQTKYKFALEKLSKLLNEERKKQMILKRVSLKY